MFFLSACGEVITEFEVPSTANTGDIIRINLSVNTTNDGQNDTVNYAILMPSNWSVVLVNQTFPVNQSLTEDISFAVIVNDGDPAPEGYVWRGFVGEGYGPYSENDTHKGFALLNVTSPGTFTLKSAVGYRSSGVENISGEETIVVSGPDISLPYSFDLNSCRLLEQSGTYTMTSSFDATSNGCFSLMKNDTTIDCQGYSLGGKLEYNDAIYYFGDIIENITLKNCILEEFGISSLSRTVSITLNGAPPSTYNLITLDNMTLRNGRGLGLDLKGGSITVRNSRVSNFTGDGAEFKVFSYINISNVIIEDTLNAISLEGFTPRENIFENISILGSSQRDILISFSSVFSFLPIFSEFADVTSEGVPIHFYRFTGGSPVIENQEFSQLIIQDSGNFDLTLRNISLVNPEQRSEISYVGKTISSSILIENSNISNGYGINFIGGDIVCNFIARNSYFSNNYNGIGITGSTGNCPSNLQDTILIYNNTFVYNTSLPASGAYILGGEVYFNNSNSGNIWLTEDNQGFSQVCDDVDNNSICDTTFQVSLFVPHYDYMAQRSNVLFPQPIISFSSGEDVSSLFPLSSFSSLFIIIFLLLSFFFY